jgi:hypothetical protein
MDEHEFRESLYAKFPKHFKQINALIGLAQSALQTYKGFHKDAYEASLALIFPRAFKSCGSVRALCELAMCEDAAVVMRSLLNLVVVTRWIKLDLPKRADKYLAWYWMQMYAEITAKTPPERLAVIQKNFDRVRPQFEYLNAKGKTKLAKKWYEPEANNLYDLFEQVGLKDHYDTYAFLSGIEHSDATAYYGMLIGAKMPDGEHRLEIQNDMFVPRYLENAFHYFGEIFSICNESIRLADGGSLEETLEVGRQFYKSQREGPPAPTV